jgi:hypothetical protein
MALVQNLKKILSNMAEKILVELSYHYIKQRAKQTLEKRVNSSRTTFSQNLLTMEHQHTTIPTLSEDSTEKIIMETQIEPVVQVRDWAIEKIEMLYETNSHYNADALLAEFDEWINIPDGNEEITYLCLEDNEWTDQELDVK